MYPKFQYARCLGCRSKLEQDAEEVRAIYEAGKYVLVKP